MDGRKKLLFDLETEIVLTTGGVGFDSFFGGIIEGRIVFEELDVIEPEGVELIGVLDGELEANAVTVPVVVPDIVFVVVLVEE